VIDRRVCMSRCGILRASRSAAGGTQPATGIGLAEEERRVCRAAMRREHSCESTSPWWSSWALVPSSRGGVVDDGR